MPNAGIPNEKECIYKQVNRQKSLVLTMHSLLSDVNSWFVWHI